MNPENIECPNCGAANSAVQSYCSECQWNLYTAAATTGTRRRRSDPGTWWIVGFVVLLGTLWPAYSVYRFNNPRPSAPPKTATSQDGARTIAGDHWIGCTDRDYHSKMNMYLVQKDVDAFRVALAAGIAAGICTRLTAGERVFITDSAVFSGLVQIRKEGSVREYWTNIEALNRR